MRYWISALLFPAVAWLGCAGGDGTVDQLKLSHVGTIGADWSVNDSAVLMPADLHVLGNTLYFLDRAEPDVRVLSREVSLLARIGARGGGPVEVAVIHDGILVADRRVGADRCLGSMRPARLRDL